MNTEEEGYGREEDIRKKSFLIIAYYMRYWYTHILILNNWPYLLLANAFNKLLVLMLDIVTY